MCGTKLTSNVNYCYKCGVNVSKIINEIKDESTKENIVRFMCLECYCPIDLSNAKIGDKVECTECEEIYEIISLKPPELKIISSRFICPSCHRNIYLSNAKIGDKVECTECEEIYEIISLKPPELKIISFICSGCDHIIDLSNAKIGDKVECTECEVIYEIISLNSLAIKSSEDYLDYPDIDNCPTEEEISEDYHDDFEYSIRCCFCGTFGSEDNDIIQVEEGIHICEDCIEKRGGL